MCMNWMHVPEGIKEDRQIARIYRKAKRCGYEQCIKALNEYYRRDVSTADRLPEHEHILTLYNKLKELSCPEIEDEIEILGKMIGAWSRNGKPTGLHSREKYPNKDYRPQQSHLHSLLTKLQDMDN
jgi:hypothetical protein